MNAARARLQVYDQEVGSDEDISELLHDCKLLQDKPARNPQNVPVHQVKRPQHTTHAQPAMMTQTIPREQLASSAHQKNSSIALAEAIAESINASPVSLPVPEPSVFIGDPLRYKVHVFPNADRQEEHSSK